MSFITVGGAVYTESQAKAVIAGFAFGTTSLNWSSPPGSVGPPPSASTRGRWGYRTYDCLPADTGPLSVADLSITASIDSRVDGEAILGMLGVAPETSEAFARIPPWVKFWDLPQGHLASLPPAGTDSSWMFRAWSLLSGVPGVGVAIANKTLHHKRPWLFPLLDGVTEKAYPLGQAWVHVHRELTTQQPQFAKLEIWFTDRAIQHQGTPLWRLRLHDILLWSDLSGARVEAENLGGPFI
jgi:hypothetical protein